MPTQYLPQNENCVGWGKVVERIPQVHLHDLQADEVKVVIEDVEEGMEAHPTYDYNLEPKGFAAWPAKDLCLRGIDV